MIAALTVQHAWRSASRIAGFMTGGNTDAVVLTAQEGEVYNSISSRREGSKPKRSGSSHATPRGAWTHGALGASLAGEAVTTGPRLPGVAAWIPEVGMPSGRSRGGESSECAPDGAEWPSQGAREVWASVDAGIASARDRLGRLARAIESDVIPKLVQLHRAPAVEGVPAAHGPRADQVDAFVGLVLAGSEAGVTQAIDAWRGQGLSVERLYLELLAPAARRLGTLWEEDSADFAAVTVGLGRLQRLLRELSPAFGSEVEHPPNGRRILLCQPEDEQHSFGLSMVAEFFRRGGWEVQGGPSSAGLDPVSAVRREWFDVIGFSVGAERRLDWLASRIAAVRRASRNSAIVVLVGGPLFTLHPERAAQVGADAVPVDGAAAPGIAEKMLSEGASREVRGTRPVR